MSSRWSYGPDGLRERPAARWSDSALPAWRELQPLLIRSAGVVGVVATIIAVVSSDAFHIGNNSEDSAGGEASLVPVVAAASELEAAPAQVAMAEPAALSELSAEPSPTAIPDLRRGARAAPDEPDPVMTASVAAAAADIAATGMAAAEPAAVVPPPAPAGMLPQAAPAPEQGTSASAPAASAPLPSSAAMPADAPAVEIPVSPSSPENPSAASAAALPPNATGISSAADFSLSSLRPSDIRSTDTKTSGFDWPNGAATCLRDWVTEEGSREDSGGDCMSTASLLAPVAEDERSALEDAAAEEAQLLALLPRVPYPRPEPPADFKPSNPHATRVSSRNSSWPAEPPPDCAAGQRAKWRFVDRRAGTKEWYCR